MQVVTASQVQIIGIGGRPFCPAHNVHVAVNTLENNESDLGAQSSSYQKA